MSNATMYKGFRYPAAIISHVVWLYFRFSLSFRDIEELMASRGIFVTYETIRQWTLKFGQTYANALRRRQPKRGDKWHLDEVVLTIKGQHHYLWRAVDQEGHTLDVLAQRRHDRQAAKRFFRKLLKGLQYVRAAGAGDGQTKELRCGEGADHARCRASAAQRSQQPGRSLAPANPATRTADAAIQNAGPGPTFFIGTWPHQQYLPLPAPSFAGSAVPVRPGCGVFTLE